MKSPWNYLQPVWKWIIGFVLLVGFITVAFYSSGCSSTVVPNQVASRTIAFDGAEQNAGVLKVWPNAALITEAKKSEYDALVALYGRGTAGHELVPPVRSGRGLTRLLGWKWGFPLHPVVWHIDGQALTDFLLLKEWQREGRTPF